MPRFAHFATATPAGGFAPLSAQPLANPSPRFLLPAPHTAARALQQFAVVSIRQRQLSYCAASHAVIPAFVSSIHGAIFFAVFNRTQIILAFSIEFPRQCSFRLCHFQRHLFALVMHVFVETVAGFPARILVPCTLYRRVPRRCTRASAPGMDAPPHPTRAGGKRYRLRGQYYG